MVCSLGRTAPWVARAAALTRALSCPAAATHCTRAAAAVAGHGATLHVLCFTLCMMFTCVLCLNLCTHRLPPPFPASPPTPSSFAVAAWGVPAGLLVGWVAIPALTEEFKQETFPFLYGKKEQQ